MIYTDSEPTSKSTILTRATISVTGSQVTVDCEFAVECPLALCVFIYREYNNSTLTVTDYSPTTDFPVSVTVDQPEKFTFAILGVNCEGAIEERPATSLKLDVRAMCTKPGKYTYNNYDTLLYGVGGEICCIPPHHHAYQSL